MRGLFRKPAVRSLASVEQENQNLFTAAALVLVQRTQTVVQILLPSASLRRSPVPVIFDRASRDRLISALHRTRPDCCAYAKDANGMDRQRSRPRRLAECVGGLSEQEHRHASQVTVRAASTIGIDMGKNTPDMVDLDSLGAIILRKRVSRRRITSRLANLPPCLVSIEAGMATHYVARELAALGHDVKQVPPTYAKPFRQEHKNDFRDAHAVAEAVQRPTTRIAPAKTNEQLDLQALHRVRSRLVSERTAVINQIRGFLLERGIIVRQGHRFLRHLLPGILAKRRDVLSPRMTRIVSDLVGDWRQLDERIENR